MRPVPVEYVRFSQTGQMHFCDGTYCGICLNEKKAEAQPIVQAVNDYHESLSQGTPTAMPPVLNKLYKFRASLVPAKVHKLVEKPISRMEVVPVKSNIR